MKDADNAQEEKKEAGTDQGEKKDVPMVDAAKKTEEAQVETVGLEFPQGADAAGKTDDAKVNTEVSVLPEGEDAAGKTEEAEVNVEVLKLPKGADSAGKTEDAEITIEFWELPKGADAAEKTEEAGGNAVSALVSESKGDGKPTESEVAPLEGADAAGKTADAEITIEFLGLPKGAHVAEKTEEAEGNAELSVPVSENKGYGKPAESEVAPLEGEKTENGPAIKSTGPPSVEKKEEADSTINSVTLFLPNEMIEIFLRIKPDEATALMRASLASKTWIHILSSTRFRSRYVKYHGTPPLLGFFYSWPEFYGPKGDDTVGSFLPTSLFPARIPDNEVEYNLLDYRHGRVLAADLCADPINFCIWNPMSGCRSTLVAPREYDSQHVAVICAVRGCSHISCNKGNSQVVLVGIDHAVHVGFHASAHAFSTDTGKWSEQSDVLELPTDAKVLPTRAVILDEKIYFVIQYDEDAIEEDEEDIDIVMYDLSSHSLCLVDAPQRDHSLRSEFILLAMKNGNLGFAQLGWLCVEIWSGQMGPEGVPEWTVPTKVELRNFLPMQNCRYPELELLGSVEGHDVIFVATELGIFMVDLNSRKYKKVWKWEGFDTLFPYYSFYDRKVCRRPRMRKT